jgi:hypothetical protein
MTPGLGQPNLDQILSVSPVAGKHPGCALKASLAPIHERREISVVSLRHIRRYVDAIHIHGY